MSPPKYQSQCQPSQSKLNSLLKNLKLYQDLEDLTERIGNIVVGYTRDRKPVRAAELKAASAMAVLHNYCRTRSGCGPAGMMAAGHLRI